MAGMGKWERVRPVALPQRSRMESLQVLPEGCLASVSWSQGSGLGVSVLAPGARKWCAVPDAHIVPPKGTINGANDVQGFAGRLWWLDQAGTPATIIHSVPYTHLVC